MKKQATKISKIVVIDGDTFRCDFAGETHTIRLYDVEASKVHEPFNEELTEKLEELILRKNITLEFRRGSWGELACIVRVDGESETVNDRIKNYLYDMKRQSTSGQMRQKQVVQRRRGR